MENKRISPKWIKSLVANEIFVFGSNLDGMHGGGAARIAYQSFGAVWGQGIGLHGQTYAIPTMHGGTDVIAPYVNDFIAYAREHPELKFLVTEINLKQTKSPMRHANKLCRIGRFFIRK